MEGTLELKEKTEQLLSEEPGPRPRHGQVGGREGDNCLPARTQATCAPQS